VIVIGIDCGQKGGIAILEPDQARGYPMPLAGKEVDAREIAGLFGGYRDALVIVEKVGSMPKQGVSSTFKFGVNYGRVLGVIEALGMRYQLVTPQAWKKVVLAGTNRDKFAAVEFVNRRYPEVDLVPGRMRTAHDGIADAVCLAEYGRIAG
jgi:crossover junction endodeoxyribonuclease RuvC